MPDTFRTPTPPLATEVGAQSTHLPKGDSLLVLGTSELLVGISPEKSGRIMYFGPEGRNVIWNNPDIDYKSHATWKNWGGNKTWVTGAITQFPPSAHVDGEASILISLDENYPHNPLRAHLGSAPNRDSAFKLSRKVSIAAEAGDPSLQLVEELHCDGSERRGDLIALWSVTQIVTPKEVLIRFANPSGIEAVLELWDRETDFSPSTKTLSAIRILDANTIAIKLESMPNDFKIGFRGATAVRSVFEGGAIFEITKTEESTSGAFEKYPDHDTSFTIYGNRELGYIEVEPMTRLSNLGPHGSITMSQRWKLMHEQDIPQA